MSLLIILIFEEKLSSSLSHVELNNMTYKGYKKQKKNIKIQAVIPLILLLLHLKKSLKY